jgi:hypothetical protein
VSVWTATAPATHPSPRSQRKLARKPLKAKSGLLGRSLQDSLADITRRLKVIEAVAVTAQAALRVQDCEQDVDIADCLRHGLVDTLTTQIERMSRLCASMAGTRHESP